MKKIIISISAVLLIAVAALSIIAINGEKLFISHIRPVAPFDAAKAPPAPDYTREKFWAALPSKKTEARLVPAGAGADNQSTALVDVFYVHPTAFFGSDNWNSPMDPDSSAGGMIRGMLAVQASVFNGCYRVYAPHYREATLYSFLDSGDDGKRALDLAYGDVERAFDYYMAHYNQGRPFIIASHSQGSVHALRLLEARVEGSALYNRFIAGYLIGYRIPLEKFKRSFTRIKPCTGERDTGCVLSWNAWKEGTEPRTLGFIWYRTGWEQVGDKEVLCMNPLTWNCGSGLAEKSLHRGAVFPEMKNFWISYFTGSAGTIKITGLPAPVPNLVTARCSGGSLFVPTVKGIRDMTGRGSYHVYDYHLFYMDIRKNAAERAAAFIGTGR
jgi:hypothetical protein